MAFAFAQGALLPKRAKGDAEEAVAAPVGRVGRDAVLD